MASFNFWRVPKVFEWIRGDAFREISRVSSVKNFMKRVTSRSTPFSPIVLVSSKREISNFFFFFSKITRIEELKRRDPISDHTFLRLIIDNVLEN